jgi:hypothetical protein
MAHGLPRAVAPRGWTYNEGIYERGDINPLILNPCMLDGGEWSASRAGRFNPRGKIAHSDPNE